MAWGRGAPHREEAAPADKGPLEEGPSRRSQLPRDCLGNRRMYREGGMLALQGLWAGPSRPPRRQLRASLDLGVPLTPGPLPPHMRPLGPAPQPGATLPVGSLAGLSKLPSEANTPLLTLFPPTCPGNRRGLRAGGMRTERSSARAGSGWPCPTVPTGYVGICPSGDLGLQACLHSPNTPAPPATPFLPAYPLPSWRRGGGSGSPGAPRL